MSWMFPSSDYDDGRIRKSGECREICSLACPLMTLLIHVFSFGVCHVTVTAEWPCHMSGGAADPSIVNDLIQPGGMTYLYHHASYHMTSLTCLCFLYAKTSLSVWRWCLVTEQMYQKQQRRCSWDEGDHTSYPMFDLKCQYRYNL